MATVNIAHERFGHALAPLKPVPIIGNGPPQLLSLALGPNDTYRDEYVICFADGVTLRIPAFEMAEFHDFREQSVNAEMFSIRGCIARGEISRNDYEDLMLCAWLADLKEKSTERWYGKANNDRSV